MRVVPGVVPEVVINPKTYDLQKPKEIDPIKLSEAIFKMASNSNLRDKYGNNLHKTVKEKFNIENYYQELEKIYKDLLKD